MGTFSHNSSSEDSSASESSDEGRARFRVSVCLRRYSGDERARAFVLVRARRRVRWLQRRIARLLGVRGAGLRAADHLLPPAESLRVLRPEDTVEVIPFQEAQAENQSRRDATTQTAAEAAQPVVKTITSTRFRADIAICNGTTFHSDNRESRVETDNHHKDRDTETLMEDSTESLTESPATAAHTTIDTVDSTRDQDGDNLQGAATDGNSSEEGSLLTLKRRALELLEAQCAAAEGPPPRRRRRVRRRTRRAPLPAAPPAPLPSPRGDVARNEAASARRPRVVHSLDLDDMSFN